MIRQECLLSRPCRQAKGIRLWLAASLLIGSLLSGCGKGKAEAEPTPTPSAAVAARSSEAQNTPLGPELPTATPSPQPTTEPATPSQAAATEEPTAPATRARQPVQVTILHTNDVYGEIEPCG